MANRRIGESPAPARGRRWLLGAWCIAVSLASHTALADAPSSTAEPPRWEVLSVAEGVVILKNRRALPRAWLVGRTKLVTSEEALNTIRGLEPVAFDPREVALVESKEAPRLSGTLPTESTLKVVDYMPGRVALTTSSPVPAFLVLSESYAPGWEATVDGAAVPIYQTNYLLQGVSVPAGQHRVEMTFHAQGAKLGSLVSLGTAMLMGALGLMYRRSQLRGRALPQPADKGGTP